ncbi:2-hydroxyglutaryl-coa dehydratase subunit, putative [Heliomicrobium modesticaldum Ice1]|uniref:2-hydroxyglutaryl-coa dehydratase subunit, putative n=1 Tax=Heliobacterium modesticaldum (strain ATCC 51547 / Ice1) TaxID=498761 RepID=B0TFH9_HELMI|nr:2-hydroxyacyl-CoA dehydratase family protein [Heliomicrobium modesticaldum]ABZ83078.1 2-hydroxyglutaryl-coa dehydratase subunit, putative [Heliomicrobium modesticaldum Ice1]
MADKIGLTTTIPVEIVYAAGKIPVDLNNLFITCDAPGRLVDRAEQAGYPRNICGWIKGLYTTLLEQESLRQVIAVTQGDCSNTHALMETWQVAGVAVIPFAFPYDRDADLLRLQMEKLMQLLGADWEAVGRWKKRLDQVRKKAHEIDRLTWEAGVVDGQTNHLALVGCSDFNGDPDAYEAYLDGIIAEAARNSTQGLAGDRQAVRLAYVGVPPIVSDLYSYVESMGARVVFNEVQRQFAMPFDEDDIIEQYRRYTYPYSIFDRIDDINREVARRRVDGIIHYTQSFCYRQIEDIILRQRTAVPVLTLEGDRPGPLDARSRMRIDAFLDMLAR